MPGRSFRLLCSASTLEVNRQTFFRYRPPPTHPIHFFFFVLFFFNSHVIFTEYQLLLFLSLFFSACLRFEIEGAADADDSASLKKTITGKNTKLRTRLVRKRDLYICIYIWR